MSLLDVLVFLIAALVIAFLGASAATVLAIALGVLFVVRLSRGERLP